MYQKDYLLRYIEQLSKAITKLLNKKNEGDIEGAFDYLNHYYQETIGLNNDQPLYLFTPNQLLKYLSDNFQPSVEELTTFARLVEAEAQLWETRENIDEAIHRYSLAFALVNEAIEKDKTTFSLERNRQKRHYEKKVNQLSHL